MHKFLPFIALAAGLCSVACQREQPQRAVVPPTNTPAVTAPDTPVAPTPPATPQRPTAAYDRYRAEMQRIRAAREQARALQANERCINGQRFRKVGSAWERAGNC